MYSTPASTLAIENPGHSDMTAQAANAGISASSGATMNRKRFERVGITTSLISSLITSAKGCSRPFGPTRFGPMRACM